MAVQDKTTLKTYFNTGDFPTETEFADFIDSSVNDITTITPTTDVTVALTDSSTTYVFVGDGDVIFNLPSVAIANIGTNFTFINTTTSRVTIQTADSDTIDDSGAGATIYNGDSDADMSSSDNSGWDADIASVKIQLITATQWHILHGRKSWTSTQFV